MQQDSLIIYSGGMDSTTLLYEYKDVIGMAISFNYGSKHNDREFEYAERNTKELGIKHIKIDLRSIMSNFKSNLLQGGGEIPHGHYAEENMKKTVVPFRNGIMLSIASGIAESNGYKKVLIANHFGDHDVYPDCRVDFIDNMNKAVKFGTWEGIEIIAPYSSITKRDIAEIAKKNGLSLGDISYSCYEGDDIHCGKCGTCVERAEALDGFDTTKYKNNKYWRNLCK